MKHEIWNSMVPELLVSEFGKSLAFYTDTLGFAIRIRRGAPDFAYLEFGQIQLMIEQIDDESWLTGVLAPPYGRGVNFQMEIADIRPLLTRINQAHWPLFEEPEDNWYDTGDMLSGEREFLVQDPDGYLLRFVQHLGERKKA